MAQPDRDSSPSPAAKWLFWGLYLLAAALLAWAYLTPDRSALHGHNHDWWNGAMEYLRRQAR